MSDNLNFAIHPNTKAIGYSRNTSYKGDKNA